MSANPVTCPFCTKSFTVEEELDSVFCLYCGTKFDLSSSRVGTDFSKNFQQILETSFNGGNYKDAELYCNKILEINPDQSSIWLKKGFSIINQDILRCNDAKTCWDKALELCSDISKKAHFLDEIKDNIHSAWKQLVQSLCKNYMDKKMLQQGELLIELFEKFTPFAYDLFQKYESVAEYDGIKDFYCQETSKIIRNVWDYISDRIKSGGRKMRLDYCDECVRLATQCDRLCKICIENDVDNKIYTEITDELYLIRLNINLTITDITFFGGYSDGITTAHYFFPHQERKNMNKEYFEIKHEHHDRHIEHIIRRHLDANPEEKLRRETLYQRMAKEAMRISKQELYLQEQIASLEEEMQALKTTSIGKRAKTKKTLEALKEKCQNLFQEDSVWPELEQNWKSITMDILENEAPKLNEYAPNILDKQLAKIRTGLI